MGLSPAKLALSVVSAIILLITIAVAQDIGHLGVNTDPIPLVQVKRQRNFIARANRSSPNQIASSRPNPANSTLTVDVSPIAGTTGKGTNMALKPNPSTQQLPTASSSADSAMIAASKIDPTTIAPNA